MTDTTIVTEIAELRRAAEVEPDIGWIKVDPAFVIQLCDLASRAVPAAPDVGDEKPVCPTCNGVGLVGGLVRYGDGDVDSVHEPCPDCAFPDAWMSPDHIAAFQRVEKGMAWASPESTEFYSTALYTAEQVARIREQARCGAIAECIAALKKEREAFLSEEYAYPQPIGSLSERFACDECIKAIEALAEAKS